MWNRPVTLLIRHKSRASFYNKFTLPDKLVLSARSETQMVGGCRRGEQGRVDQKPWP